MATTPATAIQTPVHFRPDIIALLAAPTVSFIASQSTYVLFCVTAGRNGSLFGSSLPWPTGEYSASFRGKILASTSTEPRDRPLKAG